MSANKLALAVMAMLVAVTALGAFPTASAANDQYWSGSSTGTASTCVPGSTMTVSWEIIYRPTEPTGQQWYSSWSTSVNPYGLCESVGPDGECVGYLQTYIVSVPNEGTTVSGTPPSYTVAPIAVFEYSGVCTDGMSVSSFNVNSFVQVSVTVQV